MRTRQPSERPRPAACRSGRARTLASRAARALVPLRGSGSHRAWRGLYTWGLAATVSAIAWGGARAQGGGSPGTAAAGSAAIEAMKGDLRRLVSANEVYRAKNKRYAADIGALAGYRASGGVTVALLNASATGWAAKATAAALPGKSCVISVGTVPSPPKTDATGRTAPDAVVTCDPA